MAISRGRLSAGVLLCLAATLYWRSVVDIDIGLHLAGGRWIAEHGTVPTTDPFTWTVSDHAYVAYHWGFQLALYGVERLAGVAGTVTLRFALLLATTLLLLDVLRVRGVSALSGALLGLLGLFAAEWRFTLRPELVSWLLAAAMLCLLERHRAGRRAPLWLLPALQLVWANTHVHVFGLALLGVYALDDALRAGSWRRPLLGWGGVALAAVLVNPYGLTGALVPLELATRLSGDDAFGRGIAELVSPFAIAPDPSDPFSMSAQLSAYRVLFALGIAAVALHLWRRGLVDAAVIAGFGLLSALAVRNVGLYVVVAGPALCVAFDAMAGPDDPHQSARRRRFADGLLAATLVAALLTVPRVVSGTFYAADRRHDRFSAELCRLCLALDTADWIARSDLSGNGLNDLNLGSVLIWRDPSRKVFIDGRNEVTGAAFYSAYQRALDPEHWPETLTRYEPEYVALAHRGDQRAAALSRRLLADPDWKLVHLDGAGVVFVRASGPNGSLPAASLPVRVSESERAHRVPGLRAASSTRERLARWLWSTRPPPGARHGLGNFLARAGLPEAAERPLLEAAEAHPDAFEPHLDLGLVYRDRGFQRAALRALRNAAALAPDHPGLEPLRDRPEVDE